MWHPARDGPLECSDMLLTQCPQCYTIFRVRPEDLVRADGRASCGACGAVFDALANLRDQLPGEAATETPAPGFSRHALAQEPGAEAAPETMAYGDSVFDLSDLPPLHEDDMAFEEADIGEVLEEEGFTATEPDEPTPARSFRSRWSANLAWGIGCVALTLLLAAQGMVSRQAVAGFSPLRGIAESVCELAGCRLSLPREPHELGLVNRDVQPHPTVEGALLISATMVNRAPYPQEWPMLEITLADLNGRLLAMRRFGPDIYLSSAMDPDAGIPPDTPIHVVFETEDPGDQAVAFEFQFR